MFVQNAASLSMPSLDARSLIEAAIQSAVTWELTTLIFVPSAFHRFEYSNQYAPEGCTTVQEYFFAGLKRESTLEILEYQWSASSFVRVGKNWSAKSISLTPPWQNKNFG